MARAYSADMRQRVIDRVESGASRREAAEHYEVSPSTAVIWVKCFRATGRCAAKSRGGSTSPLEKHADFLLALIELEPDLTLDEVVGVMRELKIPGSRTAVWRFFQRHKITFKKKPARNGAGAPTPKWCGFTAVASAANGWWIINRRVTGRRSPSSPLCARMA
jgi:transposase